MPPQEGKSGVSRISHFDPEEHGLAVKIAAEVKNFSIADFYPDKRKVGSMLKEMDRVTLFAMAAAKPPQVKKSGGALKRF